MRSNVRASSPSSSSPRPDRLVERTCAIRSAACSSRLMRRACTAAADAAERKRDRECDDRRVPQPALDHVHRRERVCEGGREEHDDPVASSDRDLGVLHPTPCDASPLHCETSRRMRLADRCQRNRIRGDPPTRHAARVGTDRERQRLVGEDAENDGPGVGGNGDDLGGVLPDVRIACSETAHLGKWDGCHAGSRSSPSMGAAVRA